jgi:hypothetical protein
MRSAIWAARGVSSFDRNTALISGSAESKKEPAPSHELAKLLLRRAGTFLQRCEAIAVVNHLGMPLNEIETYLDWLDSTRTVGLD